MTTHDQSRPGAPQMPHPIASFCLCAIALLLLLSCGRTPADAEPNANQQSTEPAGPPWFEEVAKQRGIDFIYESGHRPHAAAPFLMPESLGGGAALFDMNNNGWLDLYIVQSGSLHDPPDQRPGNALFRNDGEGRFTDITESSQTGDREYGQGVAVGDYNNNGFLDLYVTNVGRDVLYHNNGDETFTDVTDRAGLGGPDGHPGAGWGTAAAFFDFNRNGWLDLYVTRYLNWSIDSEINCYNSMGERDYCSPVNYDAPARDLLYRNEGDGTFADVSIEAGLDANLGTGLGIVTGDFTGNGWIDVFIANDGMLDQLWANQGPPESPGTARFIDIGLTAGVAVDHEGIAKAGMGVAAADVNDNGRLDVIVCNLQGESDSFFINEGNYFTDAASIAGIRPVSRAFTRFGMGWHDFDNDGYLDLFQANGRVMRQAHQHANPSDDPYAEPNTLFRGRGLPTADRGQRVPRFDEARPRGGTAQPLIYTSRAAAFGDIDNDGSTDIVIVNRDGPVNLLRNIIGSDHNWIMFRVLNERGRDAYNATLIFALGERTITRDVRTAYSYFAANDPRVHIGLAAHDAVTDLTITWPDGTRERFGAFPANHIHTLRRGEGTPP